MIYSCTMSQSPHKNEIGNKRKEKKKTFFLLSHLNLIEECEMFSMIALK